MKPLFIPAKVKFQLDEEKIKSFSKELPENIALAYSVQYENVAAKVQQILKDKITKTIQVLGCSTPAFSKNTKAILLISDGKFHAVSLAKETGLPVYLLEEDKLTKISDKDVGDLEKKQKAGYVKFLNANKVGVLISSKSGQQNLKKALDFKRKLKNKSAYLFICNNIDTNQFQNFGLNSWVNTACRRLDLEDTSIINIDEIKQ